MAAKSDKVIITCAVTGAIHTPTMSDALPITPDQIAEQAIAVMLFAPKGLWGLVADRFGWQLLPLERRLRFTADMPNT